MEIMESRKRNKDLQDEILGMNYREAKLRDQRDKQAKKMYEFATVDYFLVPELANVFGELSRNQANVSNHHEALLNRVDARTCQELELVADLVEQIKTQLDVYCRNRADFDAEQRKSNLGANSGSWYGFFQPSDSPRYRGILLKFRVLGKMAISGSKWPLLGQNGKFLAQQMLSGIF